MALSEKSRSALYQALSRTIDEEVVAEMLAHFPARDVEEPVTREHLDRRIAELRGELHAEISGLRGELRAEIAGVREVIAATANRVLVWLFAAMVAVAGVAVSLSGRLGG